MSKVKIQGNASGTGVVTLTAPNTNTDRTITLPDSTGSILDSTSTLDATKLSGVLPAIDGASLTSLTSGNLTGALPAIDGSALTGVGGIIIHDTVLSATNKSISNTQTTWSTVITKTFTPQSANSYFYAEVYHNEHINIGTPNYGGGMRIMEGSTEIARGGQMLYATGALSPYFYNGDAKVWGGFHSPNSAAALTFTAQATGTNSQTGNNYYWHWQSNYIADQPGPRLRIVEFT